MSAGAPLSICLARVEEDAKEMRTLSLCWSIKRFPMSVMALVVDAAAKTVTVSISAAPATGDKFSHNVKITKPIVSLSLFKIFHFIGHFLSGK